VAPRRQEVKRGRTDHDLANASTPAILTIIPNDLEECYRGSLLPFVTNVKYEARRSKTPMNPLGHMPSTDPTGTRSSTTRRDEASHIQREEANVSPVLFSICPHVFNPDLNMKNPWLEFDPRRPRGEKSSEQNGPNFLKICSFFPCYSPYLRRK